ncbi:MAG TPA: GGDEF domain-containing protein [Bacillus bacterium]|nr:GGDEF domain-containing protein [Bacillus sp. (in: firmicutes)]
MLNIDYFKPYNDTYGHQGGDGCLKQVANIAQKTLGRPSDLLCRYGGEEFCVILPETDEVGAATVGEKIRKAIEDMQIPHAGSKISRWVTVSIGTATIVPTLYTSPENLIAFADKAVYEAKKAGRNCVRTYER